MTDILDCRVSVFKEHGFSCIKADTDNFLLLKGVYYLIYTATGKGFVNVGVYDCFSEELLEGSNYGGSGTVLGNCIIECDADKSFRMASSGGCDIELEVVRLG